MTYAPNYAVPENVSPFVPLPILTRCASCREPQEPLTLMVKVVDRRPVRNLCQRCADAA